MSVVYWGFEIVATFVETFIILFSMYSFFQPKLNYKNNIIANSFFFIIIGGLTLLFNNLSANVKDILDLIIVGLYIVICFGLYKGNSFVRIVLPIILMIIILVINISVDSLLSYFFNVSPDFLLVPGSSLRIISLFITKFAFFIISQILIKVIKKNEYLLNRDEWLGITILFFISAIMLFSAAEIQYDKIDEKFDMFIITTGIALINVFVFVLINKITKKNKQVTLLQVLNTQQTEHMKALQSIEELYNSMNVLKHNMKNEWIVVYAEMNKGEFMRAEELVKNMIELTDDVFEETVSLSQPSINSILNYKINCAKQNGIYCTSLIQDDFNSFDEYDMVMLISNLLDNAIEASRDSDNPRIDITITTKMNYLSITICNSTKESVLLKNAKLKSSKADKENHGFGLKSVRQITEKYNGMLDFFEQDDMFYVDVLLKKETPPIIENIPYTN